MDDLLDLFFSDLIMDVIGGLLSNRRRWVRWLSRGCAVLVVGCIVLLCIGGTVLTTGGA